MNGNFPLVWFIRIQNSQKIGSTLLRWGCRFASSPPLGRMMQIRMKLGTHALSNLLPGGIRSFEVCCYWRRGLQKAAVRVTDEAIRLSERAHWQKGGCHGKKIRSALLNRRSCLQFFMLRNLKSTEDSGTCECPGMIAKIRRLGLNSWRKAPHEEIDYTHQGLSIVVLRACHFGQGCLMLWKTELPPPPLCGSILEPSRPPTMGLPEKNYPTSQEIGCFFFLIWVCHFDGITRCCLGPGGFKDVFCFFLPPITGEMIHFFRVFQELLRSKKHYARPWVLILRVGNLRMRFLEDVPSIYPSGN